MNQSTGLVQMDWSKSDSIGRGKDVNSAFTPAVFFVEVLNFSQTGEVIRVFEAF